MFARRQFPPYCDVLAGILTDGTTFPCMKKDEGKMFRWAHPQVHIDANAEDPLIVPKQVPTEYT